MPSSLPGSEPDHFHALDLAMNALEDAGLKYGEYDGQNIGVILGHGIHANRANTNGVQHAIAVDQTVDLLKALYPALGEPDLAEIKGVFRDQLPIINVDSSPGLVPNVMTGRIANRLDLMGPNYIIDAACASSLIAVESAMLELQRGRADVMLAGGINTSTSPLVYMVFCVIGALSRNSRVRPFDQGADGTLLGEGGGILVLKRIKDALAAGDRVYAVLKGVGQSSDGRARGLMAPRLEGEYLAMRRAYQETAIDPLSIGLLEAHGTGIPLGDRTEIGAIGRIWGERSRRYPNIALGSVKSMIGHCIPAAGIASLIKMSLALHHKVLPPTLCDEVDSRLGMTKLPFYVNTETRAWQHQGRRPRRAAVNAFGFGGVNSHAILEEAPDGTGDACAAFIPRERVGAPALLLFSALDREALLASINSFAERLAADQVNLHQEALEQWRHLEPGEHQRLAVIANSVEGLRQQLSTLAVRLSDPAKLKLQTRGGIYFSQKSLPGKVAFLFPGENSQYSGMLTDLALHFPEVRDWFDLLDDMFAGDRDFAPTEALFPAPTVLTDQERAELRERLHDTELGSESVFCADQALFHLLGRFGVQAQAMIGHSTGENAAIVASGWTNMTRADVQQYIRRMNALYRELDSSDQLPAGVLLSVGAARLEDVQRLVNADPELYLTMDNCHNQFILFGTEDAIQRATGLLRKQGAICMRLSLARGYHTPQMEPMALSFRELFRGIKVAESEIELYSCVTAEPFPREFEACIETAAQQYMRQVRFRESIERMYLSGVRVFVEVGPNNVLSSFVRDTLRDREHLAVSCDDRSRAGLEQLAHLLARLFVAGVPLDLGYWFERAGLTAQEVTGTYLPTSLPVFGLDPQQAAQVRARLQGSPTASEAPVAASATRSVTEAAPEQRRDADQASQAARSPAVAGDAPERIDAVMLEHFRLMDDVLLDEQRIMQRWLALRTRKSKASDS
jgi:acyl transferase domain-containing protein